MYLMNKVEKDQPSGCTVGQFLRGGKQLFNTRGGKQLFDTMLRHRESLLESTCKYMHA